VSGIKHGTGLSKSLFVAALLVDVFCACTPTKLEQKIVVKSIFITTKLKKIFLFIGICKFIYFYKITTFFVFIEVFNKKKHFDNPYV